MLPIAFRVHYLIVGSYLATLAPKFTAKGWQLVLSNNQYLGAARNKAAQYARGDYILFLDDDNLVTPRTLRTYTDVAARTHADILTAAHDVFEGSGRTEEGTVVGRWVPLGASPALGIFKNCFGDGIFFCSLWVGLIPIYSKFLYKEIRLHVTKGIYGRSGCWPRGPRISRKSRFGWPFFSCDT
jgi:glycosyltransferase involved in cell wall biosynthesis